MKAAVYHGPKKMTIEDVERPSADPSQIVVKVRATGICGTDVKTYLRGHRFFEPPCILGHEFSGTVAEVGSDIRGFAVGDPVAVGPYVPCGFCLHCQRGLFELCSRKTGVLSGAFTEYVTVPQAVLERGVIKLPPGMSFTEGALAEPLACALNGVEDCRLQLGDVVLIIGAGPMGLLCAQAAAAAGAGRIIVSERDPKRLQWLRKLDVIAVDSRNEDLKDVVSRYTDGMMAAAVLVCVGTAAAVEEAMSYAADGGVVNVFGGLPKDEKLSVDPGQIHYQQISLVGSFGFTPQQFRQAVNLMASGRVDSRAVISHELPFEKVLDAMDMAAAQDGIKIMLQLEE